MSAVALELTNASRPATPRHQQLRQACEELVGMALFGQILREARQSCLRSELLQSHAGDVFGQQLDDVLVQRMSGRSDNGLGEAMYRRLAAVLPPEPQQGTILDLKAP